MTEYHGHIEHRRVPLWKRLLRVEMTHAMQSSPGEFLCQFVPRWQVRAWKQNGWRLWK